MNAPGLCCISLPPVFVLSLLSLPQEVGRESSKRKREPRHRIGSGCQKPLPDEYKDDVHTNCAGLEESPLATEAKMFFSWFNSQLIKTFEDVATSVGHSSCLVLRVLTSRYLKMKSLAISHI